MSQLSTRIILRNDIKSNWDAVQDEKVLLKGEVGIEFQPSGKVKMKIGDGISTWGQLAYFGGDESHTVEVEVAKGADHLAAIASAVQSRTVNKGDIAIVKEGVIDSANADLVAGTITQKYKYTAYVYAETASGDAWKAMDGNYSADNVYFDSDFTFTTKVGTVQSLTNGSATVKAAGKSVKDFFAGLFAQEVAGSISKQPSITAVTLDGAGTYEVGTKLTPKFTATFDSGAYTYGPTPTGVTVETWKATAPTGEEWSTASGTCEELQVTDSTDYKISVAATHTAGNKAKSNIGNEGTVQIQAGTKTKDSASIKGYRKQFFGTKTTAVTVTGDVIRGLQGNGKATDTYVGKFGDTQNGFILDIPEGTKQVIIALYGKTLKDVKDQGFSCNSIRSVFNNISASTAIPVAGANNYTAVNYNVYVYQPDTALSANKYECVIE